MAETTDVWLLDALDEEPLDVSRLGGVLSSGMAGASPEGEEGSAFGEEEAPGVSPWSARVD